MSPEQKERRSESQRKYRAGFTPAQKLRRNEQNRRSYLARSPEQKASDRARDRKRNATPERKVHQGNQYKTPEGRARRRGTYLKRNYDLTPEEWGKMFADQGSCCALCKSDDPRSRWGHWATDHCHVTGKVRGILCHPCNVGLGSFKDNVTVLRAAIQYLGDQ